MSWHNNIIGSVFICTFSVKYWNLRSNCCKALSQLIFWNTYIRCVEVGNNKLIHTGTSCRLAHRYTFKLSQIHEYTLSSMHAHTCTHTLTHVCTHIPLVFVPTHTHGYTNTPEELQKQLGRLTRYALADVL